jgi:hypothetical protein
MPVAALIVVCPAIEVKAIKGHSLHADGKIGECGADFPIEAVLIHTQVSRCIAQADESRRHDMRGRVGELARASHIVGGEEFFPVRQLLIDVGRETNAMGSGRRSRRDGRRFVGFHKRPSCVVPVV